MKTSLSGYFTFKHLKGDLFGGLTSGIVALPLAMAFGEQSGMGAAAGLFGAIAIGFFASLFCSTQQQISGPTAPMTAVSMVVITNIIQAFNGSLEKALPSILLVFFLAGVVQVILGLAGIGKYIKYVPYPVISGFMTGIGIIIIIGQILPLLGYDAATDKALIEKNIPKAEAHLISKIFEKDDASSVISLKTLDSVETKLMLAKEITPGDVRQEAVAISKAQVKSPVGVVKNLGRAIQNFNWIEFLIVSATIVVIYGFQKLIAVIPTKNSFIHGLKTITSSIPSTLVALISVSSIAVLMGLNLRSIEEIPQGFPTFNFTMFTEFSFEAVRPFLMAIFSLALLGSIDSLLTSVIVDNITKTRHNSSQELISQGIGNSMSAIFGGIPGASATIRTIVNVNSGGQTRLSGIFAASLLLLILLVLAPVASMIPAAVLAGVLITVGVGIMDYRGLKAIRKMPVGDVVVMLIVMLLTIFWDLVIAVGIGLVISALIFMKKMGEISTAKSGVNKIDPSNDLPWLDEDSLPEEFKDEIFIKHLDGPIFFGYTNELQILSSQVPETSKYIIIRMEKVPYIDQSGLYALEDIFNDLKSNNIEILLTGLQKQPEYLIRKLEIIPLLVKEEQKFKTFKESVTWIVNDIHKQYA
ncbi:sodium-independent anion transporter [Mucilaginibacter hurinus]|uniref:Sodium-independent anion transporter n=1 Tax=Mucilaginibacter hurinus TaxID=2201324 RepID=A0A367GK50_9SPHI|nr:SulP family inorganic anion transporter [Mucilaginibacter hurinus]RCH53839.1 sodium-independent anion transporter [Mucilaginibacter hurinus]